jgi:hypothetical protein
MPLPYDNRLTRSSTGALGAHAPPRCSHPWHIGPVCGQRPPPVAPWVAGSGPQHQAAPAQSRVRARSSAPATPHTLYPKMRLDLSSQSNCQYRFQRGLHRQCGTLTANEKLNEGSKVGGRIDTRHPAQRNAPPKVVPFLLRPTKLHSVSHNDRTPTDSCASIPSGRKPHLYITTNRLTSSDF